MGQNFIDWGREQGFLLPPDVRDWLPADHLAWFLIEAVAEMDLSAMYLAYRADGHGRAAYEPRMMVTLLLYSFANDVRSSRAIECHCRQDVAYRVITGNLIPDHATIARFVARHERALGELFTQVLELCDRAGLVASGVVVVDGTRLAGNASRECNVTFEEVAREVLAETRATDEAEDERFGEERGDELPEQLRTPEGRREFLREAKQQLADQGAQTEPIQAEPEDCTEVERPGEAEEPGGADYAFDAEQIVARVQGREGWLREAQRQLDQHRWRDPEPVPRSRSGRLVMAAERLEDELEAEGHGNQAYEQYRIEGRTKDGRRLPSPPKPYEPPAVPDGKVNLTDPDSRLVKAHHSFPQGYNAQAVVDQSQIVLAAEITTEATDWSQLGPMISAAVGEMDRAGVPQRPEVALADAQYWNEEHIDQVVANQHIQVLIPPDASGRKQPRPGWKGGRYDWMRTVLGSEQGRGLYRRRIQMIEPVFGHTKHNRGVTRFLRRGRSAVRTEWAITDDDPQPHQAPQPPNSHPGGLNRPQPAHTVPP
ncbi:MAG: transposase, partial [Solirubrobacteraceae bacterium]